MIAKIDLEEVRAALVTRAVLEFYGWKAKRSGDEYESSACPQRSDHSRRAFLINANSGRWQCFPCAISGDLFDFIAGAERLDIRSDFSHVLAKAAEIAGVGPSQLSADERRRKREEWAAKAAAAEAKEREDRRARDAAAVPIATAYWNELPASDRRGFDYLAERRVSDVVLTDSVRFDPKHAGSPAIALYGRDGAIRNVVARRLPDLGEPKTPGLYQCPSAGTFINAICQIEQGRDVVLTEGVMDSITARVAWGAAIVLGAHGADNLPKIARLAATAVAAASTRMIVVPHADRRGFETAMAACRFAGEAGLSIARGTLEILKTGAKDLNDAWRQGWRPAA